MSELSIGVRAKSGDVAYLARYTGERFPLILAFVDRSDDSSIDVSSADLSLELGSITKSNVDFTCPYDGHDSKAKVIITEDDTSSVGTYRGQATADLTSVSDEILKTDPITLIVMSGSAALTLAEIRVELQDLATKNDLWDEEELSDDLLALARQRAVDDWNSQPGDPREYSVDTFPEEYRGMWVRGAVAHVLEKKSRNLIGNTLQVGGGVPDDKSQRAQTYLQLSQALRQEWLAFIRTEQYYENMINSFHVIGRG